VLGDDISGPHSTAVIVGRNTILACAHSLDIVQDATSPRPGPVTGISAKSRAGTSTRPRFKYLEEYWVQPNVTVKKNGKFSNEGRIPIILYKFHVENDWALFTRADGNLFGDDEIAQIDTTLLTNPRVNLTHKRAHVLHYPVATLSQIDRAEEYSIECVVSAVHLQTQSTHHVQYEGSNLCRGSSGGGIFLLGSNRILGMHTQLLTETEFDSTARRKMVILPTDKKVENDQIPYENISRGQTKKKKESRSDTVASLVGGNNGNGSGIILCKVPRLMQYVYESESVLSTKAQEDNDAETEQPIRARKDNLDENIILFCKIICFSILFILFIYQGEPWTFIMKQMFVHDVDNVNFVTPYRIAILISGTTGNI
jgi:hypothetical protein